MFADFASMGSSCRRSERFWFWLLARRLLGPAADPQPPEVHRLGGGRHGPVCRTDRRVPAAISFVPRTGCRGKALDATGLDSGSTAHRRVQEWVRAGLFFLPALAG